jgi:mRNA interferase MazF
MVEIRYYVPQKGDLVWLNFDPTKGHEQAGKRPALVLSPKAYNKIGLFIVCPITTKRKGYNTEVPLSSKSAVKGVVLTHQIHTKDWHVRTVKKGGMVQEDVLQQVLARVKLVLGI